MTAMMNFSEVLMNSSDADVTIPPICSLDDFWNIDMFADSDPVYKKRDTKIVDAFILN